MQNLLAQPETWGLLLGILTPLVTALVQQPKFSNPVRVTIAVIAALIVGTVTVLANGQFNPADWFTTVAICLVAAQTAYQTIWKPAGVAGAIERATSRSRSAYNRAA